MPAAFDKCVSSGGKIRTLSLGKSKYKRICILGGKSVGGEMHTKKEVGGAVSKELARK